MRERQTQTNTKDGSPRSGFALVITSHAMNHAYEGLLPILYPVFLSEFSLSYSLVGIIVMGYKLSSGSLQLMMAFLSRFVGRKTLLGLGMIWQSVTNSFLLVSQGFAHILVSRVLAGVGASPQHPTGSSYIAESFSASKRGRALGVNMTAAQLGSILGPIAGSLVVSSMGWRMSIVIFSIPAILIGTAFLLMHESNPSLKSSRAFNTSIFRTDIRKALQSRTILAAMIVGTVIAFRMGARDFLPLYFTRDLHMTVLEAGMLFAAYLAPGTAAPYLWGRLSDKFERRRVVMLTMGAACILWFLLSLGLNDSDVLWILIPLGFVNIGTGGVVQAFVADATDKENLDIVFGIYFTIIFTVSSFAPLIMGYLADAFSFQASFMYLAVVSLAAVFASSFLR